MLFHKCRTLSGSSRLDLLAKKPFRVYNLLRTRGIAQLGSAHGSGP